MSVEELVELFLAQSYRRAHSVMNDELQAFVLHLETFGQVFFNGNERLARERDDMWRAYSTSVQRVAAIGTCWRHLRIAQGLYGP